MVGHSERVPYSKSPKKRRMKMPEQWTDGYYLYDMMQLRYNGQIYGQEVTPGNFDYHVDRIMEAHPELNRNLFSIDVAEVKAFKEGEYRNNADEWYRRNVRAFEGAVIAIKRAANTQLSAGETTTRDKMLANYSALTTSITNLRASTSDWRTIMNTPWTPPSI